MKRRSRLLAVLLLAGCTPPGGGALPAPGTKEYEETVSAFFTGVVAIQTGANDFVGPNLKKASELAPGEAAVWANLALVSIRANQLDQAVEPLQKAVKLAPKSDEVAALEGLLAEKQGKFDAAVAAYKRAAELNPDNLKALFRLYSVADQANAPDKDAVQKDACSKILAKRPNNYVALVEQIKVAIRMRDTTALQTAVEALGVRRGTWEPKTQEAFDALRTGVKAGINPALARKAFILGNFLRPNPDGQASLREIQYSDQALGEPVRRFLTLQNPPATPAVPDMALAYSVTPSALAATATYASPLDEKDKPIVLALDATGAHPLEKPGVTLALSGARAAVALDVESDYQSEIVVVGDGGLKLFRQKNGAFVDATAGMKLSPAVTSAAYTGVWSVDIEADGDMDLVLSPKSGAPIVLQNNGDGSFVVTPSKFTGVACPLKAFAWADFDNDGDPDAVFVDSEGALVPFENQRSGLFKKQAAPATATKLVALGVAEVTGDSTLDLIALAGGKLTAYSAAAGLASWQEKALADSVLPSATTLTVADLDNNGAIDLVVSDDTKSVVLLKDEKSGYAPPISVALGQAMTADLTGTGLLGLVGTAGGKAATATATSPKNYKSLTFTLKAKEKQDDGNKINPFSVGGEIELRAGLLYQKLAISGPQVHFGLGTQAAAEALRIVWPNGNPQGEFDLKAGAIVSNQRILGASCPFLFTWNGAKMGFVTDCIWRSPLGLKINAQDTAGVSQTEDWVKIRGDQLVPKNGAYELAVTAELRETHFFDHLGLMVVDHPNDTEIFVDERFSPTEKPALKVIPMGTLQAVSEVRGWKGQDVSAVVAERDGRYVDDFGRGKYQGVTSDHWIELTVPESAPRNKPLYLVAHGWLHPTDTSINVAMGQNKSQAPPQGLSLWTPDSSGAWKLRKPGLGFPEGKVKTVVLRIDDAFAPGAPRRVRLRTNLEIFWDELKWAEAHPDSELSTVRIPLGSATLRYRGFSKVTAADASSPELPESYENLAGTAPRWRDLEGFCTRFGDVTTLLTKTDDHYVIMNAGDELRLTFAAQAAPKPGWRRDFVLIGDGWVKDGNVNTTFGKTVAPYPAHDLSSYTTPPTVLTKDAVYQRHPDDFINFHTRYITPDAFREALK